jgi:hypothetical protein
VGVWQNLDITIPNLEKNLISDPHNKLFIYTIPVILIPVSSFSLGNQQIRGTVAHTGTSDRVKAGRQLAAPQT